MSMGKRPAVMEHTTSNVNSALLDVTPRGDDYPHTATAWDVLAGKPECITDLQDFLKELDENPDLRAAATLRTLSRIRTELERVPEACGLGDPIVLKVQDMVVIARQLMSRLR